MLTCRCSIRKRPYERTAVTACRRWITSANTANSPASPRMAYGNLRQAIASRNILFVNGWCCVSVLNCVYTCSIMLFIHKWNLSFRRHLEKAHDVVDSADDKHSLLACSQCDQTFPVRQVCCSAHCHLVYHTRGECVGWQRQCVNGALVLSLLVKCCVCCSVWHAQAAIVCFTTDHRAVEQPQKMRSHRPDVWMCHLQQNIPDSWCLGRAH